MGSVQTEAPVTWVTGAWIGGVGWFRDGRVAPSSTTVETDMHEAPGTGSRGPRRVPGSHTGTTSTGHTSERITDRTVEPSASPSGAPWPLRPTTSRSAPWASSARATAGRW